MDDSRWYVLYTKSRAEKKTHKILTSSGYEVYLPLFKQLKQWSDRKKLIETPVFPSYLFIKMNLAKDYYTVLTYEGVVCFIKISGKPVPINQEEIFKIKKIVEYSKFSVSSHYDELNIGDDVLINNGSLKGLSGNLVCVKGSQKVLVNIDIIDKNIVIDIPTDYVVKK